MPTVSQTRMVAMEPGQLWQLVCDPWQLPRWWPRVERVEGVEGGRFTELLRSPGGKLLRADFDVIVQDAAERRIGWSQRVAGTPFAHVFSAVEVQLEVRSPPGVNARPAAEVTVTLAQRPTKALWTGALGRLAHPIIARAATKTVREALDGLQRLAA